MNMKTFWVVGIALAALANARGQGLVSFANNIATAVIDGSTGQPVVTGGGFFVQLWYAPDGPISESGLSALGATINYTGPGTFDGGNRTTPITTASGDFALFQVRSWQSGLGGDWATAEANAPSNLDKVLGKSGVIRTQVGDGFLFPIGNLLTGNPALTSFTLTSVPEPKVVALGAVAISIVLLRWRRR